MTEAVSTRDARCEPKCFPDGFERRDSRENRFSGFPSSSARSTRTCTARGLNDRPTASALTPALERDLPGVFIALQPENLGGDWRSWANVRDRDAFEIQARRRGVHPEMGGSTWGRGSDGGVFLVLGVDTIVGDTRAAEYRRFRIRGPPKTSGGRLLRLKETFGKRPRSE